MCRKPWRLETVRSPEAGVMCSCEPTLGHMQEHLSLLTAELPLQPYNMFLFPNFIWLIIIHRNDSMFLFVFGTR